MKKSLFLSSMLAVSILAFGCDQQKATNADVSHSQSADSHAGHEHEGHDHGVEGHSAKHGGHLIEIGRNHEYHAELVDDQKSQTVTVYMLDSHMEPLTINEPSLDLVLTETDATESFVLTANQTGGSSEFVSSDEALLELFKEKNVKGKLRVNIEGKPFSGSFDHHPHDDDESHAEHDH